MDRAVEKVEAMPRESLLRDKNTSSINQRRNSKVTIFSTPNSVEFKHISNILQILTGLLCLSSVTVCAK